MYNRILWVVVNETHWRNKVFGARQSSRTWLNPLHIKYTTGIIRKKSQNTQHVTVQSQQHKAGAELALKRIYQDKKVFATNLASVESLGRFHLQSILYRVLILVHSHFDLIISLVFQLASRTIAQMANEMQFCCTGGPRLVRFLGFWKNRTMQNSY